MIEQTTRFKRQEGKKVIQTEKLQLLKNPAKEEERAVNVEEIRLPWQHCEHKESLLDEE